jgi:threonine dehydratase
VPSDVTPAGISAALARIRDHIRETPVVAIAGADFGLPETRLVFKLEQLQHSGSFKARGAFANLLLRDIPPAGVTAASGGNHGAAVAFAARARGVKAKIFVPTVSSPAKVERIRGYGAELVVTGDRYADALAASEAWVAQSGSLSIHAFDQTETMLGTGTLGCELERQVGALDTVLVAVGGGGLLADAVPCARGRLPGRRRDRRDRGGFAQPPPGRRIGLPDCATAGRSRRAGERRGDRRSAARAVGRDPHRRRARRGGTVRRVDRRRLCAGAGRAHRRGGERREYNGGGVCGPGVMRSAFPAKPRLMAAIAETHGSPR